MANQNQMIQQKDLTDSVAARVTEMRNEDGLALPDRYNYSNALKSAYFAIEGVKDRNKQPALSVCTKKSIANALLNMVIQGLTPAKTQCYFVVYGKELQLQRSYFGTQAVLKRLKDVKDIWAEVIHEGDSFEIGSERGRTIVKEFEPKFANLDKQIIGAFAVVEKKDGEQVFTVMTKNDIDRSWKKSRSGGAVQREFPGEMAKRTVINRAAKAFINTSDDSGLLTESINNTTENEYDNDHEIKQAEPVVEKLEEKIKTAKEPKKAEKVDEPKNSESFVKDEQKAEKEEVKETPFDQYQETKDQLNEESQKNELPFDEPEQESLFTDPRYGHDERTVNYAEDDMPF